MTEQNSSKGFFGVYLRYRLRQQKMNFILCVILNILALPLLAFSTKNGIKDQLDNFYHVGRIGAIMSGFALFILAVAGAVMSFEFYNTKNLTDTLGVLPITNKQRFFGDLIGGYIANVAPIIPCGAIAAAVMSSYQPSFDKLLSTYNIELGFKLGPLGLDLFLLMLFALTMAYLITVFVASACGKSFHSIIFSIFMIAGLPLFFGGIAGYFVINMLGIETSGYMMRVMMFFPPLMLLKNAFDHCNISEIVRSGDLSKLEFYALKPVYIIVWIAFAAALIIGAYFLGKRRKPENVGSAVIIRPIFFIICWLASGGACAAILGYGYSKAIYIPIAAILTGLTVCIVMLLIWLPNKKYLPRGFISGGLSIVAAVGLCVLFDNTGCLGARYFPNDPAKIEYIISDEDIKITEKEDIETYTNSLNKILHNSYYIEYGDYTVEYKLTDGKTIKRGYDGSVLGGGFFQISMRECEKSLKYYVKYLFEDMSENWEDLSCSVSVNDGVISIPDERSGEFLEIILKEADEKRQSGAEIFGKATFYSTKRTRTLDVRSDYTETIAFLNEFSGEAVTDPEEKLFVIIYSRNEANPFYLSVTIRNKHTDNELVKELISLLKMDADRSGSDDSFSFLSKNGYYVPKENSVRVLDIMLELAKN